MLARQILCQDSEYKLPVPIDPRVIADIGANIGLTALYFAVTYPNARIFCFEPLPENINLLRLNTAPFADRITIIPKGLGQHEGVFTYHLSDDPRNFGGGAFHDLGCDPARSRHLPVTTLHQACRELHIHRIDLLKIDTEGAEWPVFRGAPPHLIENCQAIIGELHSNNDQDLLSSLSHTHHLGYSKTFHQNNYPFVAIRKQPPHLAATRLAA
jgi:FkbM family methyltransferase